jgi:hypothetical protein
MRATGTFEVTMTPEPAYDVVDGVPFSRASLSKRFTGAMVGTGTVQMLGARTPFERSAGYVALERFTGSLDGREGSFALVHIGLMNRGERSLTVKIVADSGTGSLTGISGQMDIRIDDKKHHYELVYDLPE